LIRADTEPITTDTELLCPENETYPCDTSEFRERARQLTQGAAAALDDAVSYVRDMLDDLGAFIRAHPEQALAVAVVAGFFLGRRLRRH